MIFRSSQNYLDKNPVAKGYLFAFLATLGMSNVYIFSKAAMKELSLVQFGFYWFGLAMLWSLGYMIISGKIKLARGLNRKSHILLIIIGFFELLAATTLFMAIDKIENPAVVSFLANLTPIFVTIFGISFLKEKFNLVEGTGIILTLAGAVIISYTGQKSLSEIFIDGTGLILISSLSLSTSIIIAKSRIVKIDPSILTLNRIVYLFYFTLVLMLITGESPVISGRALFNVTVGSVMGPFLTGLAQYSALKYIEASRTMIIQSTRGLLVIIGAIIYLGIFPRPHQVTGGIITIAGVIIITLGKTRLQRNRKLRPEARKKF